MLEIAFVAAVLSVSDGAVRDGIGPVESVRQLPTDRGTSVYVGNKAPLKTGPMVKLPIGAFKPSGWVGEALKLQRDGLTGNLGEISLWLTKKGNAWLQNDGKGEYGWEEVPYWLRGYLRLAYVLNDPKMIAESNSWVEAAFKSRRENGDFGPIQMRGNKRDLWAQMLMLQVLQSHFEATGDARVLDLMAKFFAFEMTIPDDQFLEDYWENSRGGDNLASVYWLYNRTGDAKLLELATKIDKNTANWRQKDNLPNWHVVNIAECFRAPATFWLQSGKAEDLEATYRNFRMARERYGQVPGGMFGADENARPGHTDPHQAAETCSFVEQIYSNTFMTEMTGDPMWAANTEDVAFNTMPAAFTTDYRALRYLTAPNQVTGDAKNHAPGIANSGPFFLMSPFSNRCCQHNHTSAWVNYTEHAWLGTNDNGLAAVLFSPGELTAKAGKGTVTIATETNYPFEEEIRFTIKESTAGEFPVYVRIPVWAEGATVAVGGAASPVKAGEYAKVSRDWKAGETFTVKLPMKVRVREWTQNQNSVSVDYGALTFSLKIEEQYKPVASDKTTQHDSGWQPTADPSKWPSHEIYPGSAWNYALVVDKSDPAKSFEVVKRPFPKTGLPFTNDAAPIQIKAKGRKLPGWTMDRHGLVGALPLSPVEADSPVTDVVLTPMGGARLRISAFPVVK